MPSPSTREKPRAWRSRLEPRDELAKVERRRTPAIEARDGGRIEVDMRARSATDRSHAVLAIVVYDIGECIARLAWGGEVATVVAIRPDATLTSADAIESPRERDDEAADASRQRVVFGFDDHVDVVRLKREMRDPKALAGVPAQ